MNKGLSCVGKQFGLIALIILLSFIFFLIGLMIGYGLIGDGHNMFAILSPNKWQSIINKFTGN